MEWSLSVRLLEAGALLPSESRAATFVVKPALGFICLQVEL